MKQINLEAEDLVMFSDPAGYPEISGDLRRGLENTLLSETNTKLRTLINGAMREKDEAV